MMFYWMKNQYFILTYGILDKTLIGATALQIMFDKVDEINRDYDELNV